MLKLVSTTTMTEDISRSSIDNRLSTGRKKKQKQNSRTKFNDSYKYAFCCYYWRARAVSPQANRSSATKAFEIYSMIL